MYLTIHDAKTDLNLTIPANIGVPGGIWTNHTLDFLSPNGYAPISTRDTSGTLYIQTKYVALFRFSDFFNIWGQPFNKDCVWTYCATPAELVVYDSNYNGIYDSGDLPVNQANATAATIGSVLTSDPNIKFIDLKNNGVWDQTESIVYDRNNNSTFESNDIVIHDGVTEPTVGDHLSVDPKLRFVDSRGEFVNQGPDGVWENTQPPPLMSDNGSHEGCLNDWGLSNGYSWTIVFNAPIAAASFGCKP